MTALHPWTPDPKREDGTCLCGRDEHSPLHPHDFLRAPDAEPAGSETLCCCSLALSAGVHRINA